MQKDGITPGRRDGLFNIICDVKDVEFTTVWNQGHTMAERTGNSTDNFIAWVNQVITK